MDDCSCVSSSRTIRFEDANGATVANFIALCGQGMYWGGRTHDAFYQTILGTHMWIPTKGMLDLIARLANLANDGLYFKMTAGPHLVYLKEEMQADDVAAVLGCDVKEVIDHFRVLITVRGHGA